MVAALLQTDIYFKVDIWLHLHLVEELPFKSYNAPILQQQHAEVPDTEGKLSVFRNVFFQHHFQLHNTWKKTIMYLAPFQNRCSQ